MNKFNSTADMTGRTTDGGDESTAPRLTRRERYEKLLQSAEYNTGGPETPMRAGVAKHSLFMTATAHGRYDQDGMRTAYRAAIENEDLLPWKDRDGTVRLTLTDDEALEDLVDEERARDDTCAELVERARELQEGSTDGE